MPFKYTRVLQFNFEDAEAYGVDKITGKDIVSLALKLGANTITFFARDAWGRAFYNSRNLRKISKLEDRDLLKEIVEEASRHGISVIPMVGHTTNPELYSKHPDWGQVDRNGKTIAMDTDPNLVKRPRQSWPLMCLNSPFLNVVEEEIDEVLAYGVHGVFLDSFRYMPDADRACFCRWCREKYKAETGMELPLEEDVNSTAYWRSFRWRININVHALKRLKDFLKARKSDAVIVYNSHPLAWRGRANTIAEYSRNFVDIFFAECSEVDYQPPGFIAEMVKLTRALTGKPVWASRNSFHMALTSAQTTPLAIRMGLREAFAGGGWPLFLVFASTYLSGIDTSPVEQVYREIAVLEEYMQDAQPLPYVAVLWSNRSRDYSGTELSPHIADSFRGFYYAMLYEGIPVNYVSDASLDEGTFTKYKAVILANAASLSEAAASNIKKYLDKGGGLIATYKTGTIGENGERLEDTLLKKAVNITFKSILKTEWSYLRITAQHPVTDGLAGKTILWGDYDRKFVDRRNPPEMGWHVVAESDGEEIAKIVLPTRSYGNEYENGRSPPPPILETRHPAIFAGRKWVYFSGQPGRIFWRNGSPAVRKLILNSIRHVAGPPPLEAKAEGLVEVEAYLKNGQILVHILNHTYVDRLIVSDNAAFNDAWTSTAESVHPPTRLIPLRNVRLILRGYEVSKAFDPLRNKKLNVEERENICKITLPALDEYMFIVIETTN